MRVRDLVSEAILGLRLYRFRSILTATSFAAGTAAAVALFAITDGAAAELLRRIESLGTDLVALRAVGAEDPTAPSLTLADAEALAETFPFVRSVAAARHLETSVLTPDGRVGIAVVGVTPGFFDLLGMRFERGRPAGLEAGPGLVCVLGPSAARTLFAKGQAYGSLVKTEGNWYRVVGVLAADLPALGGSVDRTVYLPIRSTFRGDPVAERQAVREIWLRLDPDVAPAAVAPVLERALVRRHDGRRGFEVVPPEALLRSHRETRGLVDGLLAAVAMAGLLLGGVAMAGVSWQGVSRRTREIAVRRAVGATRENVLAQFLLEGALLAVVGAFAGVVLGIVLAAAAASIAGWPWILSPARIVSSALVAIGIGAVATLLPAARAARLDPIAALRLFE